MYWFVISLLLQIEDTTNHHLENAYTGATLANLKKQRSQSRSSALNENGSVVGAANNNEGSPSVPNNLALGTGTFDSMTNNSSSLMDFSQTTSDLSSSSPPSVIKFSGITGDVVSDSTGSKKCCIIM